MINIPPSLTGWASYTHALYELRQELRRGNVVTDRTGVGTASSFGHSIRFPLTSTYNDQLTTLTVTDFPLCTLRRIHWKSVVGELLWFLSGSTSVHDLHKYGVTFWDEWADPDGELGRVYGAQWRSWNGEVDQIDELLSSLALNPKSRRHLLTAWNPSDFAHQRLPACHALAQFYVDSSFGLHCQMYQRSADIFLGVPYNIASYALLTMLIAAELRMTPASLTMVFGDLHLYTNHANAADAVLDGYIAPHCYHRLKEPAPAITVDLPTEVGLRYWKPDQIRLSGYNPRMSVTAPVAV